MNTLIYLKKTISRVGLWSILNNLARKSLPIIKKYILPEALKLCSSIIEKARSNPDNLINKQDLKTLARNLSQKLVKKKTLSSFGGENIEKEKKTC